MENTVTISMKEYEDLKKRSETNLKNGKVVYIKERFDDRRVESTLTYKILTKDKVIELIIDLKNKEIDRLATMYVDLLDNKDEQIKRLRNLSDDILLNNTGSKRMSFREYLRHLA